METQILSVHLPRDFVKKFKAYVNAMKKNRPMDGITAQRVIYNALKEYMEKKEKNT